MPVAIDLIGSKFGRLTVVSRVAMKGWFCTCECGNTTTVSTGALRNGKTKSCGCLSVEYIASRTVRLVGCRFGSLVVINDKAEKRGCKECKCDCGSVCEKSTSDLTRGRVKSCGCMMSDRLYKHGHGTSISPTYRSWQSMKARCLNKNRPEWMNYGGRGISVCERWIDSFVNFISDMGERPEGTTIDRIDVNGNYCPENCRWATSTEQIKNRRKLATLSQVDSLLSEIESLKKEVSLLKKELAKCHY